MRNSTPVPGTTASDSSETGTDGGSSATPVPSGRDGADPDRAAVGPAREAASAAENPLPGRRADTPAEAEGRRTLSTAFVRVGPDGLLTVELRDGRVLLLRNAVLRPRDFCGTQVSGGKAGAQYCGGYAEVAAARPGGVPAPE